MSVYAVGLRSLVRLDEMCQRFDALAHAAARQSREASDPSTRAAGNWQDAAQALVECGAPHAAARVLRARLACGIQLNPEAHATLAAMTIIAQAVSPGHAEDTIALLGDLEIRGRLDALLGADDTPPLSEILVTVASLYSSLGNTEGAKRLLLEALWLEPNHALAMNNLAFQLLE